MKKLLLTLLAAAVTLAAAAGGISSAAELAAFAEAVNAGGDIAAWQDERGEVHLKADIDMSGIKRFARIGNFEGVFDGEGHAILNWKTDGGLFRLVAEGSVVRNLVIAESCSMKVSDDGDDALYAGFVADVNHGILERCENYGSIAHRSARSLHDNYVGGVCGMNKYVVIRCKNGGDISSAGSCRRWPRRPSRGCTWAACWAEASGVRCRGLSWPGARTPGASAIRARSSFRTSAASWATTCA